MALEFKIVLVLEMFYDQAIKDSISNMLVFLKRHLNLSSLYDIDSSYNIEIFEVALM